MPHPLRLAPSGLLSRLAATLTLSLSACGAPPPPALPSHATEDLGSAKQAPEDESALVAGSSAPPPPHSVAPVESPVPTASLEAVLIEPTLVERDFSDAFKAEKVNGAFVLYDADQERGWVYHRELAKRGFLPCSTFKIPHTLIALEQKALTDAETVLPWDGKRTWNPDWNYDRTLREAFRFSVVPYYRQVARRIGPGPMQSWLTRLEYGNQDMTGPADLFWLEGALRISALEQVSFLQRLNTGRLPVTPRSVGILRDIMRFGSRGDVTVFGKTGSGEGRNGEPRVMWFVGWVERGHQVAYFATLLVDPPEDAWAASRHVTDRLLTQLGYL